MLKRTHSLYSTFLTAFALAASGAAAGCTITTDDNGLVTGRGRRVDAGTSVTTTAACNTCIYDQCKAPLSACSDPTACSKIYACASANPAGADACIAQYPDGEDAYRTLADCNAYAACSGCSATCGDLASQLNYRCELYALPDGGDLTADGGSIPDATPQAVRCSDCNARQCGPQNEACVPNSECAKYIECVQGNQTTPPCEDQECRDACSLGYPDGQTAATRLTSCYNDNCAATCTLQ